MNRRDFLRSLAGLPFLTLLRPEGAEMESVDKFKQLQLELIEAAKSDPGIVAPWVEPEFIQLGPERKLSKWNGAGDSWESVDGGKTWNQTKFAPSCEGEFGLVEGKEIWLKWNGREFEGILSDDSHTR